MITGPSNGLRAVPPLRPGDRVALIAPSGAVAPERVQPALDALTRMGYEPVAGPSVYNRLRYLAGADSLRAEDINRMFASDDIRGIFVIRGGYGAARVLELLDYELIRRRPKVFAGYSDVTALHTVFNQVCGFITFHAPMVGAEPWNEDDGCTAQGLKTAVEGRYPGAVLSPPGQPMRVLRGGHCCGRLTGGNLSTVVSLLGTAYELDTTGRILFLEDVNEPPYRIDRMLTQLRLCGKLRAAAGLAFGQFTDCGDENELIEIFNEFVPDGTPAVYNLAAGHSAPTLTLALGAMYRLDAGSRPVFIAYQ